MVTVSRTYYPNRLRKYRKLMGYRQKDVAILLGLGANNATRISRWEQGIALPSLPNLLKLSILYRALVNQLYYDLFLEYRPDIFKAEAVFKSSSLTIHE
jgi:transcriptional regulator with XRE-family HTH domain